MTTNETLALELEKLAAQVDQLETNAKLAASASDELPQQFKEATGLELDDETRSFLEARPAFRDALTKRAAVSKDREPLGSAVLKQAANGETPSDPYAKFANTIRDVSTRD